MRKTIIVLFSTFITLICNFTINIENSSAQWSVYQIDPNKDIYSLSSFPFTSKVFSGTANGVLYSSDNGSTWSNHGLTGLKVTSITTSNSINLFAGTSNGLIYKSSNLGISWTTALTLAKSINNITSSYPFVFAGTDTGLYRSSNNGANWALVSGVLSTASIKSLSANGSKIFAGSLNGVVYFSSDNGNNWVIRTTQPIQNSSITSLTFDGNIIYACMSTNNANDPNSIFKSTNDGANWIKFQINASPIRTSGSPDLTHIRTVKLVVYGNNISVADSYYGIYHSTNGGTNWTLKNDALGNRWVSSLMLNNEKIFAGTKGGIFVSNWPNIIWTDNNFPYNMRGDLYALSLMKPGISIIFPQGTLFLVSSIGIFKSSNYGTNWIPMNNGLSSTDASSIIATESGRLFAGTTNGIYTKLYNDSNWVYSNLAQSDIIDFRGSGSNIYAISPTAGFYRSSNNGVSWALINNGLPNTNVNAMANNGDTIYCFLKHVLNNGLNRATPTGYIWQSINNQDSLIGSIEVSGNNIYAYGEYFSKSTNGGNNWTYDKVVIQLKVPPLNTLNMTLGYNNNDIFVTDPDSGIYRSTNLGTNWTNISNELGGHNYLSIVTDSLYLYTSDEYGCIWKRSLQSINVGIKNISSEIPNSFSLEQNYPNPFNPTTKIKFAISKADFVKLKIYDITGRLMQTLTNENLNPGIYEVSFNGSKFASGVYFYKLEAGNYSETKRMLLIK